MSKIITLATIATIAMTSFAQAATHCKPLTQADCKPEIACSWSEGWKAGQAKKNGKGSYKRDRAPSCKYSSKAGRVMLEGFLRKAGKIK